MTHFPIHVNFRPRLISFESKTDHFEVFISSRNSQLRVWKVILFLFFVGQTPYNTNSQSIIVACATDKLYGVRNGH